uniref:Uncharacterized protein n=1 Tax=Anguilla anguilla TaxID=7936 RepID=A0A0E9UCH1_ANGAN
MHQKVVSLFKQKDALMHHLWKTNEIKVTDRLYI